MAQPQNLTLTAGDNDGEVDGAIEPVPSTRNYEVQTSTDPTKPELWVTVLTSPRSSFTLTGLPSGTRLWVRVRAHGALGPGPSSDPATKMVP